MDEATIGRYQVIRELGRGGMGQVFLARDPQLRRDVAIKLLHRDAADDPEAIERFRDEARHAAALRHPNIVTIYEIGQQGDRDFIAMEYLPGRSLRHLLAAPSRPATNEVLRIAKLVADALATAHATRLLHRDIKPENVVVSASGEVKVVDFGLARRLQDRAPPTRDATPAHRARSIADALIRRMPSQADRLTVETARPPTAPDVANAPTIAGAEVSTATETLCGTPAYMAPELLHGEPASAASDVYALGVTLYEALAGRRPFEGGSFYESLEHAIDPDVQAPPLAGVEPAIAEVVARMLAKEPARRPAMTEVARALADAVDPMLAAVAKARRRTWLAIAAALVAIAVAVPVILHVSGTPERGQTSVLVAPITVEPNVLGVHRVAPEAVSDAFSTVLRAWGAAKPTPWTEAKPGSKLRDDLRTYTEGGEPTEPELLAAAKTRGISQLLVGTIARRGSGLVGRFTLVDVETSQRQALDEVTSELDLSQSLEASVRAIAMRLEPRLDLPAPGSQPAVATVLVRKGSELTNRVNWYHARPYLELAVALDTRNLEGWLALARTRAWTQAPTGHTLAALAQARASAQDDTERAVVDGIALFYREEHAAAIETLSHALEQLDRAPPGRARPDLALEARYHLGEAYWHDGQHAKGSEHLAAVLAGSEQRYKHAAKHLAEHALGLRDEVIAQRYVSLMEERDAPVAFAMGRYQDAIRSDPEYASHVALTFGDYDAARTHFERHDALSLALYEASMALGRRDEATAASRLAEALDHIERAPRPISGALAYQLDSLGEVLLCAGRGRDLTRVLEVWRRVQPPEEGKESVAYQQLAIFAQPLTGKPFTSVPRTTRLRVAAAALEAERAGRVDAAIETLRGLVADPSGRGEYHERCTLARIHRARGEHDAVEALCRDLMRPAIFRPASLPIGVACEDWTGHSRATWPTPR